jgi:6-pyruvoyl-tetrahydropterin synthase
MYTVTTGIHIHFAHHVRGHLGPCISLHGHTWLFQVTLTSEELDEQGFVADFDILHEQVLQPCHALLDHSLALGAQSYTEVKEALAGVGKQFVASRQVLHGHLGEEQAMHKGDLGGAHNEKPGGIKVCVFPFTPTSERIAEWLHGVAQKVMGNERVKVKSTRIYETLHPVESYADFG